jgi:hypothetical protein
MMGATERMKELLAFLVERGSHGECPSYREMQQHMGLRSKSGVFRLLGELEERGLIRRLPRRARAIEVLVGGAFDFATVQACAAVAMDVIADHERFPGIRIEAYSVASTIARGIYRMAGLEPPPMPDAGLPSLYISRAEAEERARSKRVHLMWGMRTSLNGKPPIVQPLSLAFMKEDAPRRLRLDPTLAQELVRVRVTVEEIEETE